MRAGIVVIKKFAIALLVIVGVYFYSGVATAQMTGQEALEQRLHSKLGKILNSDEYLLDIKLTADSAGASAPADNFLPGLQVLGPLYDSNDRPVRSMILIGRADLLLILDKAVSPQRVQVAQEIISRTLEAEGLKESVKVSSQQRDIKKVVSAPPAPPKPEREPTFFEQVIQEKEFVSRALAVFWGILVSLMVIYFVLRKMLASSVSSVSSSSSEHKGGAGGSSGLLGSGQISANASLVGADQPGIRAESSRVERYSKEDNLLSLIEEITEESKRHPQKVGRILSRWVSINSEFSRAAALFLRNCDIKTVEMISREMHPSDLESIIVHKIEDFDPLSADNRRAIERMRSDLAVLASEVVLRERPDPLGFMRKMSDEEIKNLLEGETEESVALVASQLPAHRLQKFYESLAPDSLKAIISKLCNLGGVSVRDFETLQIHLNNKYQALSNNLVSEKDLMVSIQATVSALSSPELQCDLLNKLRSDNQRIYEKVRPSIFLASDLRFVPSRIKAIIAQNIDADTLGVATSGLQVSFDSFLEGLAPAYQSVFSDARARRNESNFVNDSWRTAQTQIMELIAQGIFSKKEVAYTISRAEESIAEESDVKNDELSGIDRGAA